MCPSKKDYQNGVLIKIYDDKNEYQIRSFWTQEPEMFLKMYSFMYENGIDIDIAYDENDDDPYNNKTGTIKDITISAGGSYTFNVIKIYIEVRDYK